MSSFFPKHPPSLPGKYLILLLGILYFCNFLSLDAQEPQRESGMYFLQNFEVEDYQAHNQNWAIAQDSRGIMYIGNGQGLLEYDGSTWRLISLPKKSVVRSLAVDSTGHIFVGGHGEFGFLTPDSIGQLIYQSLLPQVPEDEQTFTNVWSVHCTPYGVFYRTDTHLFLWNGTKMEFWKPNDWFHRSFWVQGNLYIRDHGTGVKRFAGDSLELIPSGELFAKVGIGIMLPYRNNSLLIGRSGGDLIVFDGQKITPFPTEVDSFLIKNTLYKGVLLPGEKIALATLGGGVVVLDLEGKFLGKINEQTGLLDNTVWSLGVDQQGALWMGLNAGIARAELSSPFTYFSSQLGLESSVESIVRHKGRLYIATGLGVLALDSSRENGDLPTFQPIGGINAQSWNLLSTEAGLLAATTNGAYLIQGDDSRLISDLLFYTFCRSQLDSTLIYAGLVDGLARLRLNAGQWEFVDRIPGVTEEIRTIVEEANGTLWMGSHFSGAFRVGAPDSPDPQVKRFDRANSLPIGEVYVSNLHGKVIFGTQKGLRKFDPESQSFVPLPEWGAHLMDSTHSIPRFIADSSGRLWVVRVQNNRKEIGVFEQNEEGHFLPLSTPLKRIAGYDAFNGILHEEGRGAVWLGSDRKMVRFEFASSPEEKLPQTSLIRQVIIDQLPGAKQFQEIAYVQNNLRFEYALPSYDNPSANQYQYWLEGYEEQWSDWSTERIKEYTNLSAGEYTFHVKGKNIFGQLAKEDVYTFRILPPWFLTWWAIGLWTICIGGLGYLILTSYVRYQSRKQALALQEERKINEQLQKVDKLKDQFLANTSHELRTPLQGIIGLSESLLEQEERPDVREDISMIISSGKRLNNLVNDILDFSKLKNFDIELLRKPINLHVLVNIVLRNNSPLVKGKNVELINAISVDLPAVDGDENRLQQIFYNLVGNAIKFTEEGHVKVNAVSKGKQILVSVEDTGTGVPKSKQEAIFQEFEQGDGSISREFTGTGLGLSISKRLVELHGGEMWVESDPDDSAGKKGSTFFFTLNASNQAASTLSAGLMEKMSQWRHSQRRNAVNDGGQQVANGDPTSPEQSIRLLIIDDESINQQVLKHHLSDQRFTITQAMNGEEALTIIAKQPPFDLVLLDVMMPRMSGYDVCQKIREKYLPSELPVIMVTAKDQIQDVVQGLSVGANDYLPKPFYKEELLARINTQLDLHRIFQVAGRFIPYDFLRALNRERITEVLLGDYAEREVTVMFTDIRDYTALAETMTPEENFKFVKAFHKRMGPLIQKHNGFVNQYLGDGIMALFPKVPEDALASAIEMKKGLVAYNEHREAAGWKALSIGTGLHSGSLIMGIIGDENRMDAATIADSVNTASRIESLTKHYGASILLSEDSLQKMENPGQFLIRYLGKVQVKGKQEPVDIYECFDGDGPALIRHKTETKKEFEQGLQQFFNKEFAQAAATFDRITKIHTHDLPAKYFRNRASEHLLKGVPDDWTGIEVMRFK